MPALTRGMCRTHYLRERKHGSPDVVAVRYRLDADRILERRQSLGLTQEALRRRAGIGSPTTMVNVEKGRGTVTEGPRTMLAGALGLDVEAITIEVEVW